MMRFFRLLAWMLVLPILYIGGNLGYGTFTDFQPLKVMPSEAIAHSKVETIADSTLTFAIWNVGYGGMGKEMEFFYDAGYYFTSGDKMKRQTKTHVQRNVKGVEDFLQNHPADFYLFQEVDIDSKRSYRSNQLEKYARIKPNYSTHFAANLDVKRIPIPIFEFWDVYGKAYSGLGTLSEYEPIEAKRLQLPGSFEWPTYIFQLDRCIGYYKYRLQNGKNLVVLNIHNSAYDKDGAIKKQQIEYFRKLVLEEYKQGNYVIAGGDWNQCPPDFPYKQFRPSFGGNYFQSNIEKELLPEGWQWVADTSTPTNRKSDQVYDTKTSFVTLIDFFLISPNIELVNVKGVNQDFTYSDHQPVLMTVKLK